MKKQIVIALVVACAVLAGCMPQNRPMPSKVVKGVVFGKAVTKNGKPAFDETQTRLSRNKKDGFCWFAVVKDDYASKPLMLTETFQLPGKGVFTSDNPERKVTSSNDGKTWTIKVMQTADKNQKMVGNCWSLADNDPLGDYALEVDVDGEFQHTFRYSVEQ